MQGAPYDVLSGPAGGRENWPVQSSCWEHLSSAPPQHAAFSTTHSPQGGAVAHISCVSYPIPISQLFLEQIFTSNNLIWTEWGSAVCTKRNADLICDCMCRVFQWDFDQSELAGSVPSFPVHCQTTGSAWLSVPHTAGPFCVCGRDHRVHSRSTAALQFSQIKTRRQIETK